MENFANISIINKDGAFKLPLGASINHFLSLKNVLFIVIDTHCDMSTKIICSLITNEIPVMIISDLLSRNDYLKISKEIKNSVLLYSEKSFAKGKIWNLSKKNNISTIEQPKLITSSKQSIDQNLGLILMTSGSTGIPKFVAISKDDLKARANQEIQYFKITQEDKVLNILPFSHDVGLNQLLCGIFHKHSLFISKTWNPKVLIEVIKKYKINGVSLTPFYWKLLIEHDLINDLLDTNLKYLTISAGDLSRNEHSKLLILKNKINIYKTYGQTETFRSLINTNYYKNQLAIGKKIENTQINFENSKTNQGFLTHNGTGKMLGYFNPSENKITSHQSEPIKTGDEFKVEKDFYYFLGRKDKMIKKNGNRFYPNDIINKLSNHEIEALVEYKDKKLIICLKENKKINSLLPNYMRPDKILIVPDFLKTQSGKLSARRTIEKYED